MQSRPQLKIEMEIENLKTEILHHIQTDTSGLNITWLLKKLNGIAFLETSLSSPNKNEYKCKKTQRSPQGGSQKLLYKIGSVYTEESLEKTEPYVLKLSPPGDTRNAAIVLKNRLPENKILHDIICVGLFVRELKYTNYTFNMSVLKELGDKMSNLIAMMNPASMKGKILSSTTDIVSLIYDTIEFTQLEFGKDDTTFQNTTFEPMFKEAIKIGKGKMNVTTIGELPKTASIDREKLQHIIIVILKKFSLFTERPNVTVTTWYTDSDVKIIFTNGHKFDPINFQTAPIKPDNLNFAVVKKLCLLLKIDCDVSLDCVTVTVPLLPLLTLQN